METVAVSISIDMLAAFVKVAERRSVSAAASDLGVGKGAVSKRVAHLESAVGMTLFARGTRHVALTSAGEAYLDHARRMLQEAAGAQERLRALRAELNGPIRLTAPVSWGQRVLARRLAAFLALHPGIEIELLLADRMVDLAAERIDMALRWTGAQPAGLVLAPVDEVQWALVAAPRWLSTHGVPAVPSDLAAHACMAYWRERADDAWTLTDGVDTECVRVRGRFHADNPEAVAQAALAGLGIALLPRYLCEDALDDGRLVPVLPGWTPITKFGTRILAVAMPERMCVARNRALLDFLRGPG